MQLARLVLLLLLSWSCIARAEVPEADMQRDLGELRRLALAKTPGDHHQTKADVDLINRLAPVPEAVPALVALLADPDLRVASLAGAVLRDAPHIDEKFLPEIRAGLDRDVGWLAPALARMPGEAAAKEAVARYLVSKSAPQNQENYALRLLGERALPFMVEAARCDRPCGKSDHYLMSAVLSEMGEVALPILPGLRALIEDPATPGDVTAGALLMVAAVGPAARSAEPWLLVLRETKPELREDIDQALVDIAADEAGRIMAARLDENPDPRQLFELAMVGPAGRDAGPAVVGLLSHPDADVRLAAARALGFIGYAPAAPALVEKLDAPDDLRMNWVAADSLGRLRAVQAKPALERLAAAHPYPPVRAAAANALRQMGQPVVAQKVVDDQVGGVEYSVYDRIGDDLPLCKRADVRRVDEPATAKLYLERDARALQALAFDSVVLSYGPSAEEEASAAREDRIVEVTPGNMVEHRTATREVPAVALRVDGGWLAGSNRGEWGGELMFLPDSGKPYRVMDGNIVDIHRLGGRIVATFGIAHLFLNQGQVVELALGQDARWISRPWRNLPGAPLSVSLVEGDQLLIDVVSGGTLLLSGQGGFRMAPCLD
jgi:HEAT repeat protein